MWLVDAMAISILRTSVYGTCYTSAMMQIPRILPKVTQNKNLFVGIQQKNETGKRRKPPEYTPTKFHSLGCVLSMAVK